MNVIKEIGAGVLLFIIAVLWISAGFCFGFFAGENICVWWVMPGWVREAPHDGQLGLGLFMYAMSGGFIGGIASVILGIILILRYRRKQFVSPEVLSDS